MLPSVVRSFLLVGAGGALGAMLRYGVALLAASRSAALGAEASAFPWPTLGVNLVGSLAIGLLAGPLGDREAARLLLVTGVLGGFTTFSAFSLDALGLVHAGRPGTAAVYVLASVAGGLALAALGTLLTGRG